MKNKTVIVTGGSRGIGKAISLMYAEKGANIVINYSNQEPTELKKQIEDMGVGVICVKADVSNFAEAEHLITSAKEKFGTIDVLVNNAGITRDTLLMRMSEEDFDKVIDVNLKGTFNTTRHVSGIMLKQKSGTIVNITSVIGVIGNAGQANYAASKAGIIGLTKSTAKELASRGITCNAVAPGFISTEMTDVLSDAIKDKLLESIPLKCFGSVEDVANAVYFLSTNKYITGEVLNINGGMVM